MGLFLEVLFCLLCNLMPVPHSLSYCDFIINLDIRYPTVLLWFFFFFFNVLAILSSFLSKY